MIKIFAAKLALVLVLISVAIVSPAQSGETVALYLKIGDVIFGKIIQTSEDGSVSILNDCGLFNYNSNEIDSISKIHPVNKQSFSIASNIITKKEYKFKEKGYYNVTSVALLLGQGQNGYLPVPSLTTINGWQFNKHAYAGLGIGFEYYEWAVMPIFADARYILKQEKVSPFGAIKLGYSFPVEKPTQYDNGYGGINDYYGGIQLNPELGLSIRTSKITSLLLSIGYHFQQLSYEESYYNWWENNLATEKKVTTDYNRISFRIGLMF